MFIPVGSGTERCNLFSFGFRVEKSKCLCAVTVLLSTFTNLCFHVHDFAWLVVLLSGSGHPPLLVGWLELMKCASFV